MKTGLAIFFLLLSLGARAQDASAPESDMQPAPSISEWVGYEISLRKSTLESQFQILLEDASERLRKIESLAFVNREARDIPSFVYRVKFEGKDVVWVLRTVGNYTVSKDRKKIESLSLNVITLDCQGKACPK